jgi:site-specific DNA recombinase
MISKSSTQVKFSSIILVNPIKNRKAKISNTDGFATNFAVSWVHGAVFLIENINFETMENSSIKYFAYLRKSTDSEDRQIQSIEDQKKELERFATQYNLKVVKTFQENMSAKKPGRPEFNKMILEIKKGKASGILCWKINRLTRNPVDGGEIQWLLQSGVLQSIQTPGREYKSEDNVIIMSVEQGMANQFILDLSKDVKRGLTSKAEKGQRPGLAPIGYKNDKASEKGKKEILVDEEKFPLVRKMWDLMLTGNYTVKRIADIANDEWGLRTSYHKKQTRLSLSHVYRIFTNSFYYGEFEYGGKVYQGKHKTIITPEEYDHVQKILGEKGKPRPQTKILPFNGTIHCGKCGCSFTADQKIKYVKSEGITRSYIYHRCSKSKPGIKCDQKPISSAELERQIIEILDTITIPKSYLDLALEYLRKENLIESDNTEIKRKNQLKETDSCDKSMNNLLKLYISPENENRELLSDEEYKEQKSAIQKRKLSAKAELENIDKHDGEWTKLTEDTFKFATYAKYHFAKGNYEQKTATLRALGSNFIVNDGKLSLTLAKPYQMISNCLETIKKGYGTFEPSEFASVKEKTAHLQAVSSVLSG